MLTPCTLRRIALAATLPMALTSTACITIRSPHTIEHAPPATAQRASLDTLGGRVTLRLLDGSTVDFPDGVIVRRDSVVARVPSSARPSPLRAAIGMATSRPRPIRLPSTPRSSAGRRVAAGATRADFVAGVVADSVVAMRSVERRVNRPATALATGAVAAVLFVALVVSPAGSAGQPD